jgi:hypothetical protein
MKKKRKSVMAGLSSVCGFRDGIGWDFSRMVFWRDSLHD